MGYTSYQVVRSFSQSEKTQNHVTSLKIHEHLYATFDDSTVHGVRVEGASIRNVFSAYIGDVHITKIALNGPFSALAFVKPNEISLLGETCDDFAKNVRSYARRFRDQISCDSNPKDCICDFIVEKQPCKEAFIIASNYEEIVRKNMSKLY